MNKKSKPINIILPIVYKNGTMSQMEESSAYFDEDVSERKMNREKYSKQSYRAAPAPKEPPKAAVVPVVSYKPVAKGKISIIPIKKTA
jgi:hypothetical protein